MQGARVAPTPSPRPLLKHTDTVGALASLSAAAAAAAAASGGRSKKLSHPGPVPKLSLQHHNDEATGAGGRGRRRSEDGGGGGGGGALEDDLTCRVTTSLESAVRKMSRSSPSRSPNRLDLCGIRAGLSILARGYEQYREGIQFLRPTEFGEASSDDLSSEAGRPGGRAGGGGRGRGFSSPPPPPPPPSPPKRHAAAHAVAAAAVERQYML